MYQFNKLYIFRDGKRIEITSSIWPELMRQQIDSYDTACKFLNAVVPYYMFTLKKVND